MAGMELTKLLIRTALKLTVIIGLVVAGWALHSRDAGDALYLVIWVGAGCVLASLFGDLRPDSPSQKPRAKLDKEAS
jgi:hypothetical protein